MTSSATGSRTRSRQTVRKSCCAKSKSRLRECSRRWKTSVLRSTGRVSPTTAPCSHSRSTSLSRRFTLTRVRNSTSIRPNSSERCSLRICICPRRRKQRADTAQTRRFSRACVTTTRSSTWCSTTALSQSSIQPTARACSRLLPTTAGSTRASIRPKRARAESAPPSRICRIFPSALSLAGKCASSSAQRKALFSWTLTTPRSSCECWRI